MSDLPSRRNVLRIASGTIVTGLAGCTGSNQQESDEEDDHADSQEEDTHSHGSHDEKLDGPSAEAEVLMTSGESGDHFEPHVVWVEKGGSVNWTNESGSHATTAYHAENDDPQLVPDGAAAWDSGVLSEQDAAFDHTFEIEGVYHYYCAPHETAGMIGSVIVGQPDPHGQPALEEPPSDKSETVREKLAELNEMVADALNDDYDDNQDHETDDHNDTDGHDDH